MRKVLVFAAVCAIAGVLGSPSRASCGQPTPMTNFNGYPIINCPDGKPATAYAYQPGANPATNTGTLDIVCEADGVGDQCYTMPGSNAPGDGIVGIGTDWILSGIQGCPTGRVFVNVQCNDGSGVLLSISGGCSALGYSIEAAYDAGEAGVSVDAKAANSKNGRPVLQNFTRNGGMDIFEVQVDAPAVQSDCTTGSYGQLFMSLGYCSDTELNCAGLTAPARGRLYSSTQPCSNTDARPANSIRAGLANSVWTLQNVLDGNGHGMVSLPTPATGMCNYIGTTTLIGANETDLITGFTSSGGPTAASPIAEAVRATRKGNSVEVAYSTSSELGLLGFNIYAAGKKGGEIKLNAALIPATGAAGAGSSYAKSYAIAEFKGNRSVIVESVLADNTTLRAPAVEF
jgi:hypothetical protein